MQPAVSMSTTLRRSAGLALGVLGSLAPARGQAAPPVGQAGTYTYVVRTAAHTPGKLGTFWLTDLETHNQGVVPANVNLHFLE